MHLVGGTLGRSLPLINALVADVPNTALRLLGGNLLIAHISLDRRVTGSMERTGATVGATAVRQELGYDGAGIGVAIIDSGSGPSPDDLTDGPGGISRVDRFVDFVNGRPIPYDDYGHGTHVAGIVAGNGFDSDGARAGIAPAARLIALKVLDASGQGRISDVIAALDDAVAQKDALNIRVINLSVAAAVYESYNVDPLTLAAQRAVAAGIVVVAAAGNDGRSAEGAAPVRRHHGARQRAMGADGRRLQPHGDRRSRGRHDRGVQLARSERDRQRRQARPRRAGRRHRIAERSGQRASTSPGPPIC